MAGKKVSKAPKIQRLVTPLTLQRKRARIAQKKKRIAKSKEVQHDPVPIEVPYFKVLH